jgi:uncharacterized protein DUF1905
VVCRAPATADPDPGALHRGAEFFAQVRVGQVCVGALPHESRALMRKERFEAELFEGHKGVTAVVVPFDPEDVWQLKPVKLDPRRDGWLVKGTVNRTRFDAYIGYRWGKFFIILEPELRAAARVSVGDTLSLVVEPTITAKALAKARELSKMTTAPKMGRADAVAPPVAPARRASARRAPATKIR